MSEAETFDIRNFAQTMREITYYRTRQANRPNDANSLWQAQIEVSKLRAKLERAYNSTIQKAKLKKDLVAELWMYGHYVYNQIVLGDLTIDDVTNLSGSKLTKQVDAWSQEEDLFRDDSEAFFFKKLMPSGD